jgi:hypothetical protein
VDRVALAEMVVVTAAAPPLGIALVGPTRARRGGGLSLSSSSCCYLSMCGRGVLRGGCARMREPLPPAPIGLDRVLASPTRIAVSFPSLLRPVLASSSSSSSSSSCYRRDRIMDLCPRGFR